MSSTTRTIVVLGGSYGGARATKSLAEKLPEGWRVILIERNSHANHLYVIPRYTVLDGHEHKAFIPYTNIYGPCPTSSLVLQASVIELSSNSVTLSRSFPQFGLSNVVQFDYCIYALGSHLPAPIDQWGENDIEKEENCDVLGDEDVDDDNEGGVKGEDVNNLPTKNGKKDIGSKKEAIDWLKRGQKRIKDSDNVLIIGGGALGIQFASDIKDVHPEKHVTLLHSRPRLLPRFDPLMHNEIARGLEDLGVELLLSTRLDLASLAAHSSKRPSPVSSQITASTPSSSSSSSTDTSSSSHNHHHTRSVLTTTGQELTADLVLLCTGQVPNTGLLREFAPECIDETTGYAKVNRALQLLPTSPASIPAMDSVMDAGESDVIKDKENENALSEKLNGLDLNPEEPASKPLETTPYTNIFVIGDAADSFGAIKAGYNAYFQADTASRNILRLIANMSKNESEREELEQYTPGPPMIKLSMGLKKAVFQTGTGDIGWKDNQNEDLDAPLIWNYYGADVNAPGGMYR